MTTDDHSRAILDEQQWKLVERLARSVTPLQANWLGGYFSCLGASELRQADIPVPGASTRRLSILYGTETGNAADVARSLETRARASGLSPVLFEMADYKVRQLSDEQDLLIIVSTYGVGDPPQPATGFFEFVEGRRAPKLDGMRFAVLALGDSSYEFYCEAGKRLDRRLEQLGAERLAARADCDIDFEEAAETWAGTLIDQLLVARESTASASASVRAGPPAVAVPIHDKHHPFLAPILDNMAIVGRGSTKDTRHIEFSLSGSGLTYNPDDALGIAATNDPAIVAELLTLLSIARDAVIDVKGQALTTGEALTHRFEITAATPRFLDYWALLSDAAEPITDRMSGCPNGCSRPYIAEIGLSGRAPGKYNLYFGGGFHGQRLNAMVRENIAEGEILDLLAEAIGRCVREREPGEPFGDFYHPRGHRARSDRRTFLQ